MQTADLCIFPTEKHSKHIRKLQPISLKCTALRKLCSELFIRGHRVSNILNDSFLHPSSSLSSRLCRFIPAEQCLRLTFRLNSRLVLLQQMFGRPVPLCLLTQSSGKKPKTKLCYKLFSFHVDFQWLWISETDGF